MTITHVHTARELDEPVTIPIADAINIIKNGEVDNEVGLMRWGSNYTFLVELVLDETKLLAVYKPRLGERPLWDFPDGTLCNRETAAYLTSDALGWDIVPPTVLRDGSRGVGSVQLFIDHDPEEHYFTIGDVQYLPQLERIAAFDAITNNADRKGGHCLIDANDHIWGIDHGLTFNTLPKLRTVIWDFAGEPIPEEILIDIERLCQRLSDDSDVYTRGLRDLLSDIEIETLKTRVDRLLTDKIFPLPGDGPNRPWPDV
jgi:uncharacterized repeat protein (TIGR03843 family)